MAFVRSGPDGYGDLDMWVQPVNGGEARRVTSRGYQACRAPAWTARGDSILFTASAEGGMHTWRTGLDGSEPEPVPGMGRDAVYASVRGHRMIFQQRTSQPFDLWRVPTHRSESRGRAPERLIASSAADVNADCSSDGRDPVLAGEPLGAGPLGVGMGPCRFVVLRVPPLAGSAARSLSLRVADDEASVVVGHLQLQRLDRCIALIGRASAHSRLFPSSNRRNRAALL